MYSYQNNRTVYIERRRYRATVPSCAPIRGGCSLSNACLRRPWILMRCPRFGFRSEGARPSNADRGLPCSKSPKNGGQGMLPSPFGPHKGCFSRHLRIAVSVSPDHNYGMDYIANPILTEACLDRHFLGRYTISLCCTAELWNGASYAKSTAGRSLCRRLAFSAKNTIALLLYCAKVQTAIMGGSPHTCAIDAEAASSTGAADAMRRMQIRRKRATMQEHALSKRVRREIVASSCRMRATAPHTGR